MPDPVTRRAEVSRSPRRTLPNGITFLLWGFAGGAIGTLLGVLMGWLVFTHNHPNPPLGALGTYLITLFVGGVVGAVLGTAIGFYFAWRKLCKPG